MKYKEELYLDTSIFFEDRDCNYRNHKTKIVKCRKPHPCIGGCETIIQKGEQALYESAIDDDGFMSCYICLPCIEEWLEEIEDKEYLNGMRTESEES